MLDEKQAIEKMVKVIEKTEQIARDAHCGLPSPRMYAKELYANGYRQQKEGEWVMIPVNGVVRWRCGNIDCARIIPFGTVPNELNYCPNCGAKMKGGAE